MAQAWDVRNGRNARRALRLRIHDEAGLALTTRASPPWSDAADRAEVHLLETRCGVGPRPARCTRRTRSRRCRWIVPELRHCGSPPDGIRSIDSSSELSPGQAAIRSDDSTPLGHLFRPHPQSMEPSREQIVPLPGCNLLSLSSNGVRLLFTTRENWTIKCLCPSA